MILVTGASGNVGGAVLEELLRSSASVRSMYRSTGATKSAKVIRAKARYSRSCCARAHRFAACIGLRETLRKRPQVPIQ